MCQRERGAFQVDRELLARAEPAVPVRYTRLSARVSDEEPES